MSNPEKWRAGADKLLSAPVTRRRKHKTVGVNVDVGAAAILSARRRGMTWTNIANTIKTKGTLP